MREAERYYARGELESVKTDLCRAAISYNKENLTIDELGKFAKKYAVVSQNYQRLFNRRNRAIPKDK